MNEFDLPCSDCKTVLVERTVPAGVLPVESSHGGAVTIGICPDCQARYYPHDALTALTLGDTPASRNDL